MPSYPPGFFDNAPPDAESSASGSDGSLTEYGPFVEIGTYLDSGITYNETQTGGYLSVGPSFSGICNPGEPGFVFQAASEPYDVVVTPHVDTSNWIGVNGFIWLHYGLLWPGGFHACGMLNTSGGPAITVTPPYWLGTITDGAGLSFSLEYIDGHIISDGEGWSLIDGAPERPYELFLSYTIDGPAPILPAFTIHMGGGMYIESGGWGVGWTAKTVVVGTDPVNPGDIPQIPGAPPEPGVQDWALGPCAATF